MQALLERAKALGKEELFDEVLIPEETVVEMVKGAEAHVEAQSSSPATSWCTWS